MPAEGEDAVRTIHRRLTGYLALALFQAVAGLAVAQTGARVNEPRVTASGAFAVSNLYSFRGVRQNATGVAVWPSAGVTLRVHRGDSWLEQIAVVGRTFNSLHSGDTGSGGPAGRLWYESRSSGGLRLDVAGGLAIEPLFTAYVSPNELFDTAKEVSVRVSLGHGRGQLLERVRPFAMAAVDIDTAMATGQLDGGARAGSYLEIGADPDVFRTARVTITVPLRLGLSLRNYYELADRDYRFGFVDIGGTATIPFAHSSSLGSWAIQGGVGYQRLGTTPTAFNSGDNSLMVWHIGVAFGADR